MGSSTKTKRAAQIPGRAATLDLAARVREQRVRSFLTLEDDPPLATNPGSLDDLIRRTADVYRRSLTRETRRSYVHRWTDFEHWCAKEHLPPLPASPEVVMVYLLSLVEGDAQVAISTVQGRLAAINRIHLEAGHTPPGRDPATQVFIRGLVDILGPGRRREPIKALRVGDLRTVAHDIQETDARLLRDAALVAMYASEVPASALATLKVSDVRITARTAHVRIPDPLHPELTQTIRLRDIDGMPARSALATWHRATTGASPFLFATTDRLGQRSNTPVSTADIERTILRRTAALLPGKEADYGALIARLQSGDPWALRDRAFLLLGFAGAFRCASLAELVWSDVREDPDGVIIHLRRSKTDREGRGRDVGIPYGNGRTCPVSALQAWRDHMAIQFLGEQLHDMPVFVGIERSGSLKNHRMATHSIARIVARRAEAALIPGHWGGRSLRAGFISSAADLGIPLEQISRQSGHATLDSLVRYIRIDDVFHRNAASRVGL